MSRRDVVRGVRWNIAASIAGTLAYAFSQWVLFVLLARMTSLTVVGDFSLMVALSAPLYLLIGLNLRVAQATDAREEFRSHDFINLQVLANAACLLIGLLLIPLSGLERAAWPAFAVYLLAKVVEAMSTYLYGLFQLHGRMDLVASSLMLRSLLGPVLFGTALSIHRSLLAACAGLAVAWATVQVLDRRRARALVGRRLTSWRDWSRVATLLGRAWPLGASGGVNSLTTNAPRYVVRGFFGAAGLGSFTGASFLAQMIQTIVGALGAAVIPDLARQVASHDLPAFRRLMRRTVVLTVGIVLSALAVGGLLGPWVLTVSMGEQYADRELLLSLLAGTGVVALYRCPARGLQAALRYRTCLVADGVVMVLTVLTSLVFIPSIGLAGAGLAIGCGGLGGLVLATVALRRHLGHLAGSLA